MALPAVTTQDGPVMTIYRRVGSRAPLNGLVVALLALLLLPGLALGAEWTKLDRVSSNSGSRLDSLHQAAASSGLVHIVHPRIGPRKADDKVVYQSSANDGKRWTGERILFKANATYRRSCPTWPSMPVARSWPRCSVSVVPAGTPSSSR